MDTERIEAAIIAAVTQAYCRDNATANRIHEEAVRQLVANARTSILPSLNFAASMKPRIEMEVEAEMVRQKSLIRETSDRLIDAAWSSRAGKLAETIEHHIRRSIKDALVNAIQTKLTVKDGALRFEDGGVK